MTAESFRPKFTTSASHHQEIAEEREEQGSYFGDRVRTVTGAVEPVKQKPSARPLSRTHPPEPKPLTDRQKRMLKKR